MTTVPKRVTAETVAEVRAIAERAKRLRASLPSDSWLYSVAWQVEALAGEAIGHFEAAFQKAPEIGGSVTIIPRPTKGGG